jgi:hypothetical protein
MRDVVCLIVLALTPVVSTTAAAQKPDFSGTYALDVTRTKLQGDWGIEGGQIVLVHEGDQFTLTRAFRMEGQTEPSTTSFEGVIGGPEKIMQEGAQTIHIRLYWDGDVLVADMTIQAPQGTATNVVRYTLSDGGKTLIADEKFRGPRLKYDNVWVAVKQ